MLKPLLSLILIITTWSCAGAEPPPVELAGLYHKTIDLSGYWVSEKLDGVRAYWNGSQLLSRNGNTFTAPTWFTALLPRNTALDGELWSGRGEFESLSGIVRKQQPVDAEWRRIRYMIFDLPDSPEDFDHRLQRLRHLIPSLDASWVALIPQQRVANHARLQQLLQSIIEQGGEGLMLHLGSARHQDGRSQNLLKLKPFQDAEAVVVGQLPGKGKYRGMLGSLQVKDTHNREFRIGTGLSDDQRRHPPPIGSRITYRYRGLTNSGLPRFPSFLRIRNDEPISDSLNQQR